MTPMVTKEIHCGQAKPPKKSEIHLSEELWTLSKKVGIGEADNDYLTAIEGEVLPPTAPGPLKSVQTSLQN
jgi:hypothetical protein